MRLALRVAAMAAVLIVSLVLHSLWRLVGRQSPWPRRFLGAIGRIAGMRSRIQGQPLPSRVLFVCNHLSWLDIMLVAGTTGAAFVSKDEVARWPVFGWLAKLNNTVFIARADRRNVHGQADAVRTMLGSGQPVALFPEGTTDGGPDVLPFRASLFSAVLPPDGLKVQPVAIDYGAAAHDIAWVDKEPAASNVKRVLSRRGTNIVRLEFLPPIDPASIGDRKALSEAARQAIVEALQASAVTADRL